jgi:hypothetical protein
MGIVAGSAGRCPHCKVAVRFERVRVHRPEGDMGEMHAFKYVSPSNHILETCFAACPECGRIVLIALRLGEPGKDPVTVDSQLWPDAAARPVAPEVEAEAPSLAADFREAVAVLPKSKKASAALSRRCLQAVLTNKGGATERDLAGQIDAVLPTLPSSIAANVDAIRHVGNFAAHPIKSQSSGEIVEVEDGEAEWLLDVLEELFDHYYVAPARAAAKRAELNKKLADAGKPPLKGS